MDAAIHRERNDVYMWRELQRFRHADRYKLTKIYTDTAVGRVPSGSAVKNPPASAGATGGVGLIPGSGRSPCGGHGNPFQYSCL